MLSHPIKRTCHPCPGCPSAWPVLVSASDWLISHGKKGNQSSPFLLTWLADWLGQVNPNLPSNGYQGARMVYCSGSHTTDHLFSTTRIPSTPNMSCDAWQTHRPSPWQPGGKPSVVTNLNLDYSQVYASTNLHCSCPEGASRRHQIGLLWERLSQLVNLELLFSVAAHEKTHWCLH